MFKRTRKNIFFGFSVSLVIIAIILITNIHNGIKFTNDYTLTPKYDLVRDTNNAGCMNQIALE